MKSEVWATRDEGSQLVEIWIRKVRPQKRGKMYFTGKDSTLLVCLREFEEVTGIEIEDGECLRIRIKAKIIELA